ncbi:MAG: hypothetical protein KDA94_13560 [Acidimicrobiales bacterium]|nr:hypothetical protein [Acidimicrobiales bacterium]
MFAYLDAGTLSMLSAALAGGAAGVLMLVRMYGNKFLGIFSKSARRKAEIAEGELLGIEIDPETGKPVDPEAAAEVLGTADDPSAAR